MPLTKKQLAKIHANARKIQAEFDELKRKDGSLYEKYAIKTIKKSDKPISYMDSSQKNDLYRLRKIALERMRDEPARKA